MFFGPLPFPLIVAHDFCQGTVQHPTKSDHPIGLKFLKFVYIHIHNKFIKFISITNLLQTWLQKPREES
jgi:hypothetical protein